MRCLTCRLTLWLLLIGNLAVAGDWPQILGPTRNGHAQGETLSAPWPQRGPEQAWQVAVGSGFAGPAVADGRVVLFHRVGSKERLQAWDAVTGKPLWQRDFPAAYQGGVNPDRGPRCVPLIHDGAVFAHGAAGDVHCVALSDGAPRWSRNTHDDFQGMDSFFGAGSTPVIADGKLLVNVGGRDDAGIVALRLADGTTAWKATKEQASYASPTLLHLNGQRHVLFVTRYNTLCVDPRDGRVRFQFPFGKRGPTVNAATPLVFGDKLFVTASYGIGAVMARISDRGAERVWANDDSLSSQYNSPIYRDGFLYGCHGREDIGRAQLRCLDAATGKVRWSQPDFGVAHGILAGDRLLLLTTGGELVLVRCNPDRYQELARARISPHETRALPALAHGRLYLRDNDQTRGTLRCLVVGATN